jgi:ketosteroid isomerase-like protein
MTEAVLGILTPEDVSAITAVTGRFTDAMLRGDHAAAAQLYTAAATLMAPHQPAVAGRAAILAWMASLPKITRFTFQVDAVDGRGDLNADGA